MGIEQLHADIKSHIADDPSGVAGLQAASSGLPSCWSINAAGLLRYDEHIWVPLVTSDKLDTLRVRVLQHLHDHILAGHFGQNRTLAIVRHEYTWLELRTFVQDYCKSCITCRHNKAPQH